jgi:hypothetical protein
LQIVAILLKGAWMCDIGVVINYPIRNTHSPKIIVRMCF